MQPTARHREAEAGFRRLLEAGGLPQPDEVELRADGLLFLWYEQKLAVVVDLEERADCGERDAA